MTLEFIPFTGTVEELPSEYKTFLGKFIYEKDEIEYHVIIRLNDDLYTIGDAFHFDRNFLQIVGYIGIY